MHIYSVLNKLFTPKIEQEKVQNNTNEQKQKIQGENKEKILSPKQVSKNPTKLDNKAVPVNAAGRQQTCYVSFPKTGDTLATIFNKEQTTLKLAGVDGNEKGVRWNKQALKFLKLELGIEKRSAFVDVVGKDSDGVILVELYLDKEKTIHVNKMLLEQDFAMDVKPVNENPNSTPTIEETNVVVQQANSEVLDVKPKIVDNSLWEGIPEDMGDIPMPDDDYFWQSQMAAESNFSIEEHTTTTNNEKIENPDIQFNPFAEPPIEPLSVYPNGIKPVLEMEESIIEPIWNTEVPISIDTHMDLPIEINDKAIPPLNEENTKVEFNPFVNPPIEPLSVYPNGIKPEISINISPTEETINLQINIPEKEVIEPIEKSIIDKVEPTKENIALQNNSSHPDVELPQENKPAKMVLKFGSKGKTNLPKVEDDIEATLEKNEKKITSIAADKVADVLPVPVAKIETEVKPEVRVKAKPASPLSPEYDPFLDTASASESDNNNIDITGLLADYDPLGEIVSHTEFSSTSKKKKFGN